MSIGIYVSQYVQARVPDITNRTSRQPFGVTIENSCKTR